MCKINGNGTTLENIHRAAKTEFLEKGYKDASLRNIVKSVGMTTGAFYGYYKSKEELFEDIVGEHYEYIRNRFIKAQQEFAELPAARQPEVMSDISGICMYDILHYAYEHLEECKLILVCSEGTKFAGLIDEMVEIEVEGTHAYQEVLRKLGRPSPRIDPSLEHIHSCALVSGMTLIGNSSVSGMGHFGVSAQKPANEDTYAINQCKILAERIIETIR